MNKFLWILTAVIVIGAVFVFGWKYGENISGDAGLGFVTQSVENEGTSPQTLIRGNTKIYKFPVDNTNNQPIGGNTDFVECPGSKLESINVEIGTNLAPKMYDPSNNSEINFFGYSINFVATNTTKQAKFLKAVRKPLSNGQCIYGVLDSNKKLDSLVVFDVKLDDGCRVTPEISGGFDCSEE